VLIPNITFNESLLSISGDETCGHMERHDFPIMRSLHIRCTCKFNNKNRVMSAGWQNWRPSPWDIDTIRF